MSFGPYPKDDCFNIEKSQLRSSRVKNVVRSVEFVLFKEKPSKRLLIVEAKTSAPRDVSTFVKEIQEKFNNSIILTIAACLKRHTQETNDLPASFDNLDLKPLSFVLILVIKNHKDDWLSPLKDALTQECKGLVASWGSSKVVVLNEDGARKQGLIL